MSVATRQRVRALADRMGYRPNAAARLLREMANGRAEGRFLGTLAYVVSPHEASQMRHPQARERYPWHFEPADRALRHGYSVDIFVVDPGVKEQRKIRRVMRARGIRGALIAAGNRNPKELDLDWDRLAVVTTSAQFGTNFLHNITVPYFQDTYFAAQQLIERGFERIGFVMTGNVLDAYLGGYEVAMKAAKMPVIPPLFAEVGVPKGVKSWIKRNRLDCVLTTTGSDLLMALREMGVRVPEELGFAVIDDIDDPGVLSGLRQPRLQLNRWGIDFLHNLLTHNEFGIPSDPLQMQFSSTWSEGQTLVPR